jgi:multicomponent Na+:H+ antiporter subunit D
MLALLLNPGMVLILAGLVMPFLPRLFGAPLLLLVPLLTLWQIAQFGAGFALQNGWYGTTLLPVDLGPFSRIFSVAFCLVAWGGGLFGWHRHRTDELGIGFAYAGAAVMLVTVGDWLHFVIAWELMALAAYGLIRQGGTEASSGAARRYLLLHLVGGVLLVLGAIGWVQSGNTLLLTTIDMASLSGAERFYAALILASLLLHVAAPPFSAWVADAYPESSPSGMVFLSALTTKAAVFALMRLFPGTELLLWLGLFMIAYGIVYALLENDLRRILAYSIVNQVGFMLVGIGIGSELALLGVAAHAFCHILYKSLLVMSAGAVWEATNERRCTHLGGLYRSMPWTTAAALVGGLAISAFPLTAGFISKSLIVESAHQEGMRWVFWGLMAGSAGVCLHAGVKFPWFVFFQRDSGLRPADPPWTARLAMLGFAMLALVPGWFPHLFYHALLPVMPFYQPYTVPHVLDQLLLLLASGLMFFLLLPWLKRTDTRTRDMDGWYRGGIVRMLVAMAEACLRAVAVTERGVRRSGEAVWSHAVPRLLRSMEWRPALLIGALSCLWVLLFWHEIKR